jgi:hypothetical protein
MHKLGEKFIKGRGYGVRDWTFQTYAPMTGHADREHGRRSQLDAFFVRVHHGNIGWRYHQGINLPYADMFRREIGPPH